MNLSLVIPSHNRPDLLRLCLESVLQFAPEKTQVIVVDDGSPLACVSRMAAIFAGVQIIHNPKPQGFAKAANRGIAHATGDIIELLNDDTQVTPNWAQSAMKWFADPTIAAIAPLVLQGPTRNLALTIDSAGDEYNLGGFARKRGHGERLGAEFLAAREVFGASASSAFYRADVLRAAGCFPEEFGAYFEDVDLAWRIRKAGFRTMYEPASLVWHRVGSSYRKNWALIERQSRNEERVFWRNVPNVWPMIPRHAAILAAKAVRRIREGTIVPWAFGRLRAWVNR